MLNFSFSISNLSRVPGDISGTVSPFISVHGKYSVGSPQTSIKAIIFEI